MANSLALGARSPASVPLLSIAPILVVEPDAATRWLYRQSLELLGYEVVDATDGRDALVKALIQPPRLILTETRLPFVDGYSLCEILRQDRATRSVPILVVTSDTEPARLEYIRSAGANAVLVKPTAVDVILDEVQRLIDGERDNGDNEPAHTRAGSNSTQAAARATTRSKSHARFVTVAPPTQPPELRCPVCDGPLVYQRSHVGGVNSRSTEQWDCYVCPAPAACGSYEYRQRTRKLRRVPGDEVLPAP
jgi:two-component system chemotaxis response regulator CheY